MARKSFEQDGGIGAKKGTFLLKPARIGEMMQADNRTYATLRQRCQQLAVALQGHGVPSAFFRLNAAPLHGEAQSIDSEIACQVEVSLRVYPPVAGGTTAVTGLDPTQSFPVGPLAVFVAAFDLVGGGGNAPKEVLRK